MTNYIIEVNECGEWKYYNSADSYSKACEIADDLKEFFNRRGWNKEIQIEAI